MEELFRYYASNPMASNAEAAAALGIDETKLRVYKSRLKKLSVSQTTEISREIRTILKEVV